MKKLATIASSNFFICLIATILLLTNSILSMAQCETSGLSVQIQPLGDAATNCNCDAALTATANGGSLPYTFFWYHDGLVISPNNLCAGNYSVMVIDANSCWATDSITINNTHIPTIIADNAFLCPGDSATLSTTISYQTYLWSNDATTSHITAQQPGWYSVTVTDDDGCIGASSVEVDGTINSIYDICPGPNMGISPDGNIVMYPCDPIPAMPYQCLPTSYDWSLEEAVVEGWDNYWCVGAYHVTATCSSGCQVNYQIPFAYDTPTLVGDTILCGAAPITVKVQHGAGFMALPMGYFIPEDNSWASISYIWSNGETTDSLVVHEPGTYSVTVTAAYGCTEEVSIVVGETGCLYPGDANDDGIANNFDILQIGLAYGQTGLPRSDTSLGWYAHFADDWATIFDTGLNHKYADCNGDGNIEVSDTTAVSQNYGFTHGKGDEIQSGAPLYFELDTLSGTEIGDSVILSIYLGDTDNPLSDFYGIAFSINHDGTLVQPIDIALAADNWTGNSDNCFLFRKNVGAGQTDIAITRIDHSNTTGQGRIAKATYVIIDNIDGKGDATGEYELPFSLSNTLCTSYDNPPIEIAGRTTIITSNSVMVNPREKMLVFPNPIFDRLYVRASEINAIKIMNTLGNTVYYDGNINKQPNANELYEQGIATDKWQSGLYFVQIVTKDNTVLYQPIIKW